ncbi:ribosome maturation factor RimP [Streptomyces thermolineatus]|uniref:Ribosome maturation factor RimP n=1 Tax=Streptomyces thermolineatus TaxID=44033 RepID=A0ABN3M070_9ACTN
MSTTQSDRLRKLLEPIVAPAGMDLEDVKVTAAGSRRQLLVVVDADEGVSLDAIAEVTRAVSQALDASDAMGGAPYNLEVSSPGVDRPLTEPRHYRRNTGRLVKVQLAGGGELVARITAVDEEGLDLEVPGVKGRRPTARRLAFTEIAKARVEIEFNPKGGAAEDDTAADTDES